MEHGQENIKKECADTVPRFARRIPRVASTRWTDADTVTTTQPSERSGNLWPPPIPVPGQLSLPFADQLPDTGGTDEEENNNAEHV